MSLDWNAFELNPTMNLLLLSRNSLFLENLMGIINYSFMNSSIDVNKLFYLIKCARSVIVDNLQDFFPSTIKYPMKHALTTALVNIQVFFLFHHFIHAYKEYVRSENVTFHGKLSEKLFTCKAHFSSRCSLSRKIINSLFFCE